MPLQTDSSNFAHRMPECRSSDWGSHISILLFFQSVWQRPPNKIKDVMMSYSSMGCHFWRAFPFQKSWYLFEEILTATPRPHGRLRGNRSLVVGGVPHRWDGTGNHHEATFGVGVVLRPDDVVECFLSTAIGGTSMNHSLAFEYDMTIWCNMQVSEMIRTKTAVYTLLVGIRSRFFPVIHQSHGQSQAPEVCNEKTTPHIRCAFMFSVILGGTIVYAMPVFGASKRLHAWWITRQRLVGTCVP